MTRPYDPQRVTDDWRRDTERRMAERGLSARELARLLTEAGTPATGQSVRDLLAGRTQVSSLVGAITELLGDDPPPRPGKQQQPPRADEAKTRVDQQWPSLDTTQRRVVADVVDALARRH
jgi:hypothetical protein